MLWFKCAAMHDPVRPVIKRPAVIGWEAKQRQVDLVIERPFKGGELLRRMKGWVTVDVNAVIDIVEQHGKLKLLDDIDLAVETRTPAAMETITQKLAEAFGDEVWLEQIAKALLK